MNSMVSVAMKAGTLSQVTSTPLISPTDQADAEADQDGRAEAGDRSGSARTAIENTTATRP